MGFTDFFTSATSYHPYPYQIRLAKNSTLPTPMNAPECSHRRGGDRGHRSCLAVAAVGTPGANRASKYPPGGWSTACPCVFW
jgi:hypothetical protein